MYRDISGGCHDFIIGGGLKRLADTAQKIVPVMASLYIAGGIVVVLTHLDSILPMLQSILQEACSMKAGMGAAAGLTMKEAMRFGVARGLYSNEAGEGSAAVIHSAAQVDHPARQGFYGVVEVFVDTMVICSTTGFPSWQAECLWKGQARRLWQQRHLELCPLFLSMWFRSA